jgi:hypothetical protein
MKASSTEPRGLGLDVSLDEVGHLARITHPEALHRSALAVDVQIALVEDLVPHARWFPTTPIAQEAECQQSQRRVQDPARHEAHTNPEAAPIAPCACRC